MIPVRVASDAQPVLASERLITMQVDHPMYFQPCPVCDRHLGAQDVVLVLVGIAPEDRKPAGFTNGAAVPVHASCAGVPE